MMELTDHVKFFEFLRNKGMTFDSVGIDGDSDSDPDKFVVYGATFPNAPKVVLEIREGVDE